MHSLHAPHPSGRRYRHGEVTSLFRCRGGQSPVRVERAARVSHHSYPLPSTMQREVASGSCTAPVRARVPHRRTHSISPAPCGDPLAVSKRAQADDNQTLKHHDAPRVTRRSDRYGQQEARQHGALAPRTDPSQKKRGGGAQPAFRPLLYLEVFHSCPPHSPSPPMHPPLHPPLPPPALAPRGGGAALLEGGVTPSLSWAAWRRTGRRRSRRGLSCRCGRPWCRSMLSSGTWQDSLARGRPLPR